MTGWPADWAAITCALMCSNCALRSGWLAPSRVLRLTWREYASSSTSSRPTLFGLTSWPEALSAHASFSRLLETHVSGDHGGLRRVEQRALAAVEGRVAEAGRRDRHANQGLPLSSRHIKMEQDRAPAVLPYHAELARQATRQPRRSGRVDRRDDHQNRAQGRVCAR